MGDVGDDGCEDVAWVDEDRSRTIVVDVEDVGFHAGPGTEEYIGDLGDKHEEKPPRF